jgi:PAS domain S-box-containing protein
MTPNDSEGIMTGRNDGSNELNTQPDRIETGRSTFPIGAAILDSRMNVLSFNSPMAAFSYKEDSPIPSLGNLIGCAGAGLSASASEAVERCRLCPMREAASRLFQGDQSTWGKEIFWPDPNSPAGAPIRFSILPLPFQADRGSLAQLIWEHAGMSPFPLSAQYHRDKTGRQVSDGMAALKQPMERLKLEIAERRRVEASLRESEKRYRYSVQNAPNPIFSVNKEGHLISWNKACERTFQYSADEAIGMSYHILFGEEQDLSALDKWVGQVFKGRTFDDRDFVYRGKNGSRRHTISRLYPLKGTRRQPAGCVFANTDVTERKLAEEALRRSEMELRQFSERLMALHENERKKIGETLHDSIFQNLIVLKIGLERQIGSVADQKSVSRSKLRDLIAMIQESIEQLREIIMNLRPTLIDDLGILATIRWLCRQYHDIHPAFNFISDITIREEEVPTGLKIVMFRVAQEAFDNIIQHSEANNIRFILKKTPKKIMMRIEDNGVGFNPEALRAHPDDLKGVGISSMKKRIDFSKGTFKIKSAPGQGTTIYASWPLDGIAEN